MTPEAVAAVRADHRPELAPCGCQRWVCGGCGLLWPCEAENAVRAAGVRPHGIDDYAAGLV